MNRSEEAQKILFEKMNAIIAMARREKRALTAQEKALIQDFRNLCDDELRGLPQNRPLTLQGPDGGNHRAVDGPFRSLGEQLQAVVKSSVPGQPVDQRLYDLRAATAGLNETVPSSGGFLVQTDFQTELLASAFQTAKLASMCRRFQISSGANGIKINGVDESSRVSGSRQGGILGYWLSESGEKTASKPKFRQINLELKKLIGLCYTSDELLADAVALEQIVKSAFASEIGFLVDDAIINGTGAGQPLGILNSGCLVQVDKESGQKAATIVFENIAKCWSRLLPGSEGSAVWLANKNVLPQLLQMNLAVGTGGVPVYLPANQASGSPYQQLFGRPVIFIEQAATLGTVGDLILADMGGYIFVDKGGIQTDVSIHVEYIYDQSVFRFVYRCDGQPQLASTIMSYKGSDTLSHFVAIQTRA